MIPELKAASVITEICCGWASTIIQYNDLPSQFPRPLFADHVAYSIVKRAAFMPCVAVMWQEATAML
jgi:hypothetical protein